MYMISFSRVFGPLDSKPREVGQRSERECSAGASDTRVDVQLLKRPVFEAQGSHCEVDTSVGKLV